MTACGTDEDCENFRLWVGEAAADPAKYPKKLQSSFFGLLFNKNGLYEFGYKSKGKGTKVRYMRAWGSGMDYAWACMHFGLDAHAAILKTCKYNVYTGEPVVSITQEILASLSKDFQGYWEHDARLHKTTKRKRKPPATTRRRKT